MSRRGRRGYPTVMLIGLDQNGANFWTVYSESVKPYRRIKLEGSQNTSIYKFHEEIIEVTRKLLSEGFFGVIIVSEERTEYASQLLKHIEKHHRWLTSKATVQQLIGKATSPTEVIKLIKTNKLQTKLIEINEKVGINSLEQFERALQADQVIYTIEEIIGAIKEKNKIILMIMTEEFHQKNKKNRRFQSVVQILRNLGVNILVLKPSNSASTRINQVGGLACVISDYS
jgi:stalled ribosome rescue protein Dom34